VATASASTGGAEEPTREQMVEGMCQEFERGRYHIYRVYARDELGGREEPIPVNGHVPDVKARFADKVILICVEDADTLHGEESEARWKAFGSGGFSFEVACPAELMQEARLLARARGVRVNRFWTF